MPDKAPADRGAAGDAPRGRARERTLREAFDATDEPSYAMFWLGARLRQVRGEDALATAVSLWLALSFLGEMENVVGLTSSARLLALGTVAAGTDHLPLMSIAVVVSDRFRFRGPSGSVVRLTVLCIAITSCGACLAAVPLATWSGPDPIRQSWYFYVLTPAAAGVFAAMTYWAIAGLILLRQFIRGRAGADDTTRG